MIRVDQIWLATEPIDIRAGADTALACVVKRFGKAQPHTAYIFLNKRANRMKILVHDDFGVWLAARRLHKGKFIQATAWITDKRLELTAEQLSALVVGLPWHYVGMKYPIRVPLLVLIFLFGQTAFAGPGQGHSHDHHHGPITSEQAASKATKHVQKLVKDGKPDSSWSEITFKSVEEKSYGHGPEWVVTFENKSIEYPEKQTLYVFYTINGKYLASNFTGQ